MIRSIVIAAAVVGMTGLALAQQGQGGMGQGRGMGGMGQGQPGMGPVAEKCNDDMAKFCTGKEHGSGALRDCLEANIAKVSDACKTALNTTGGGRRRP